MSVNSISTADRKQVVQGQPNMKPTTRTQGLYTDTLSTVHEIRGERMSKQLGHILSPLLSINFTINEDSQIVGYSYTHNLVTSINYGTQPASDTHK